MNDREYTVPPSPVKLTKLDMDNREKPRRDLSTRIYFGTQQTLHLKPAFRDELKKLYVEVLQHNKDLTPHGFLISLLQQAINGK